MLLCFIATKWHLVNFISSHAMQVWKLSHYFGDKSSWGAQTWDKIQGLSWKFFACKTHQSSPGKDQNQKNDFIWGGGDSRRNDFTWKENQVIYYCWVLFMMFLICRFLQSTALKVKKFLQWNWTVHKTLKISFCMKQKSNVLSASTEDLVRSSHTKWTTSAATSFPCMLVWSVQSSLCSVSSRVDVYVNSRFL